MRSKVKVMLLGIAIMLLRAAIFIGTDGFLPIVLNLVPLAGFGLVLYGYFSKDEEEDLSEKTFEIVSEQKRKAEKDVVCPRCGKSYKESYNACPWCEYKEEN